jgi:preprotein translocase subunit SecF
MLTLLSMLGGGLLRLIPFLADIFKQHTDQVHELAMTQVQLQIDQARASQAIDLAHAQASIAASAGEMAAWSAAIDGQSKPTGVGWADALSASVRPVLTYWWCLALYTAAKVVAIMVAWRAGTPLAAFAAILVTEFDTAIIGSIFSFWFVDRAIRKQTGT